LGEVDGLPAELPEDSGAADPLSRYVDTVLGGTVDLPRHEAAIDEGLLDDGVEADGQIEAA
jgi:hypothetical protein